MGRKPEPERRERVLAGVVAYLEQHGLAALSLRPLAAHVGVSPHTLLYHFGSKEQLVVEALAASPALTAAVDEFERSSDPVFARLRRLWTRTAEPRAQPYLRLFFEVYAAALRKPDRHERFRRTVVDDWLRLLEPLLRAEGATAAQARTTATELLALHHGCALDVLATGDRTRVTRAYLGALEAIERRLW